MIEFQYFDGCPNARESMTNFKLALNEINISPDDIKIVEIPDLHTAKVNIFQGSPTILVNGLDIYTKKIPEEYNYTCRIYDFDGKRTGVIPYEFILRQFKKYLNNID